MRCDVEIPFIKFNKKDVVDIKEMIKKRVAEELSNSVTGIVDELKKEVTKKITESLKKNELRIDFKKFIPTIEEAIQQSITANPDDVIDALWDDLIKSVKKMKITVKEVEK